MFSAADHNFMVDSMKIVVGSIESKLNEPFFAEFKEIAIEAISKYIAAIKKFEASVTKHYFFPSQDNEAEEFIRSHFCELVDKIDDKNVIQVFDALRHSFSCYAYNGLHQLYTRQENECWHPKIKLTEVLSPNDIESLDKELTLYRGCDISEIENNSFGQAWTTSLQVARDFAYTHYQHQIWFAGNSRIVLEATCARDQILFSEQSIEYEVVVDASKLINVRKHT